MRPHRPPREASYAHLIADAREREAFVNQTRVSGEREIPLLYTAASSDDERARLIEVIKTRQNKGERIAILLPQKREVERFARALQENGLEVEVREKRWGTSPAAALDFNSDLPKLLTYHSAKGLTFDSVLMPRLVPGSFGRLCSIENLLFVGVTRASKWVYLSTDSGPQLSAVERLRSFDGKGFLTVQTHVQHRRLPGRTDAAARPAPATGPDVLDLL